MEFFLVQTKRSPHKGGPASNGGRGSWNNNGIFNSGTSTVVFDYSDATIAGNTVFNNITITNGNTARY